MAFRRPPPSLLYTAVAASVVLLPSAISGPPAQRAPSPPAATETALIEHPLTDLGPGETIREVRQPTPFSLVALTGLDFTGAARVRAQRPDGSWGPWYATYNLGFEGPDGSPPQGGTEPVFVGRTTAVQIAIDRPAEVARVGPEGPRPGLGYIPANVEQPFGQNVNAVLITPPQAPGDQFSLPTAITPPGQPPAIISRQQWGADESIRCGAPKYDNGVRAAVVHHTAGSNDYSPQDSAEIVRAIYAYHTRTLGWCDIAYNALVDKYGQVFEGRYGGITKAVEGSHTGGFNVNTWGVAMMGDFSVVPPTPIQLRTTARLIGWRLGLDGVDPRGTVTLTSEGSSFTRYPFGAPATLPAIFTHRDVGNTECPGNAAYAQMDQLRDIAARFNQPPGPQDLADALQGGAIYARWQAMGGMNGELGAPTSPESAADGAARYVRFAHGAVYWSPQTGAQPLGGAIYDAWASLGYEHGPLGLPTSGEVEEPEW
ncbi:MAG: LGFP repeat-containing protein, partial [Mycobacteriaceae bacterium]|nr:LGFP repeat-containing protein [Mycobacteriaceae bacterium]